MSILLDRNWSSEKETSLVAHRCCCWMSNSHNLILIIFTIYSFSKKRLFIYLCLAVLGLSCCTGFLSLQRSSSQGACASDCGGFLGEELSLRSTWATGAAVLGLQSRGSTAVAPGLSCSATPGILLNQGSNPHLLHRQGDSLPLGHQGNSTLHSCQQFFFIWIYH